jgi:hypothetical protein
MSPNTVENWKNNVADPIRKVPLEKKLAVEPSGNRTTLADIVSDISWLIDISSTSNLTSEEIDLAIIDIHQKARLRKSEIIGIIKQVRHLYDELKAKQASARADNNAGIPVPQITNQEIQREILSKWDVDALKKENDILDRILLAITPEDMQKVVEFSYEEAKTEDRQRLEDKVKKELEPGARNIFESFLIKQGVPIVELQKKATAEIVNGKNEVDAWKEYFETLFHYYLSVLFEEVKGDITAQYLDISNIIKHNVEVKTAEGETLKYTGLDFLEKMKEDFEGNLEIAAESIRKAGRERFLALDFVFTLDKSYNEKNKDFKGIREFFPAGGTDRNPWVWNAVFNDLKNIYWKDKETNTWREEEVAFGRKVFLALREVIRRGRGVDSSNNQNIYVDMPPSMDPHKSDVLAAQLMKEDGEWAQYKVPVKVIPGNRSIVPFSNAIQGKSADPKLARFYEVVNQLTDSRIPSREMPRNPGESDREFLNRIRGAEYRNRNGYQLDTIASILGLKISNITGESDFQDSPAEVDKNTGKLKPGSPEGRTKLAQAFNILRTIRKYIKQDKGDGKSHATDEKIEDVVGAINVAIMMEQGLMTFFDYFGYDGKTYTQHIIENDDPSQIVWGEVTQKVAMEKGLHPSTVGQGMHPDRAQEIFGQMVEHFTPVLEEMWDPEFDLRALMKINHETGTIEEVNSKKIDKLIDSLRKILDYFTFNEAGPDPLTIDTSRPSENPTGDMIAIEVRSSLDPKLVERMVTRVHKNFPMHQVQLWRWIPFNDRSPDKMDSGSANYYIESRTDNGTVHGTKVKDTWVFELPITNKDELPTPKELLAREIVYRFIYALIYPGNQKASMDISDWAILMSVLTDEGFERMEAGWWDGPVYEQLRKRGKQLIDRLAMSSIAGKAAGAFGVKRAQFAHIGRDFLAKEIGSFKTRGIYPWETGFMLMFLLNDKIRLEEFTQVQGGMEQFFTGKRSKK